MDEMILAVNREYLFEDEELTFQGVLTDIRQVNRLSKRLNNYVEVRRGDAEENSDLKQPIPYAIISRGDEVFVYKRLAGGGESRLHDQLSIGVGGHMNRINDIRGWDSNLMLNLYRELSEELEISESFDHPEIIGLINDDTDDVGLFHIGILVVVKLPEGAEVTVRETDSLEGYWIRKQDLKKSGLFESLESWSQIAAGIL